jgi:octaprenyl-diphosphate synthase
MEKFLIYFVSPLKKYFSLDSIYRGQYDSVCNKKARMIRMPLESIRHLVQEDLETTNDFIISQLQSNVPLVKQIIKYILTCGGKRVRPMIVLLSAKALQYKAQKHIDLAASIELIHTATLLHDDVVDSSTLRRGHKTAHTIWGSNASVLVGDFLYSRAFQIIVDLKQQEVLNIFAKATHYIAEGEIIQLVNCHNPDIAEECYFDIIKRKTGKLFEVAAQLGAVLSTSSVQAITALRDYGMSLGLAYQLIDDALDYNQCTDEIGKNIGQDLADGKTTLPLIYAMRQSNPAEHMLLRQAIQAGSHEDLHSILKIIESTDAIKYTADSAKYHVEQAKRALAPIPSSPYRQALEDLSDFVVNRAY